MTDTRKQLNTHHVLKALALVLMTADHIGAFLYPDELWWRVCGRFSAPIWFFLVGHALRYDTKRDLWLWGIVLAGVNPFFGMPFLPFNTLLAIVACQYLLRLVEKHDWLARYTMRLIVASVLLILPTYLLFEYGSLGFLYALMGYAVRSRQMTPMRGWAITAAAYVFYILCMLNLFDFTLAQQLVVILGTGVLTAYMGYFVHKPVALPRWVGLPMVAMSRFSMQYYVIHRVLLQLAGVAKGVLTYGPKVM